MLDSPSTLPRRTLLILGAGLLLIGTAAGGAVALRSEPRVEELWLDRTVYTARVVRTVQTVEQVQTQRASSRRVDGVATGVTLSPDGQLLGIDRLEFHTEAQDRTSTAAVKVEKSTTVEEQHLDRLTTHEQVTAPAQPRWMFGLGVGLDVMQLSPVYAIEGSYRIAGPFWLGGQLQLTNMHPTAMVKGGVQF